MKRTTIILILIFIALNAKSQDCNCESNFQWLKATFEENDAGFSYYLKQNGKINYKLLNKRIQEKSISVNNLTECQELLLEWVHFFRTEHIGIRLTNPITNYKQLTQKEIIDKFKNWEKINLSNEAFQKYLINNSTKEYEGVWVSDDYTLGIKKENGFYLGFIIKADGVYWQKGQVKFKINANDYSGIYYMKDHSPKKIDKVDMFEDRYIRLGSYLMLKRENDNQNPNEKIDSYFKSINANNPTVKKINDNTVILRIPHMWIQYKEVLDSLVTANKSLLTSEKNLIIDIRNNGGGSDLTYESILPLIYTNPIRTVGAEFLSSNYNNTMLEYVINSNDFDQDTKDWAQNILDRANSNINHFVKMMDNEVEITKYDTIYKYPANVAILIDENVASASEQFLLDVKQSKKVKVFGTTTAGGLDLANVYEIVSPCEEFILEYATSRSMRIPELVIDEKGIQPDYFLDNSIPKYEWVDYVVKILNTK